ncbi:MAG: hypothetical protein IBX60_09285 [Candidatus Aminicenantes bacterium]|nr:hypothetical protein [Candidatus Aminicenantes bacterium]
MSTCKGLSTDWTTRGAIELRPMLQPSFLSCSATFSSHHCLCLFPTQNYLNVRIEAGERKYPKSIHEYLFGRRVEGAK